VNEENRLFRELWKMQSMQLARTWSRRAFQYSVVLFLIGTVMLVQGVIEDVYLTITVAVVFAIVTTAAVVVTLHIEGYVTSLTATK
jgi:hypothetical protein